jgi:hypothetical protein
MSDASSEASSKEAGGRGVTPLKALARAIFAQQFKQEQADTPAALRTARKSEARKAYREQRKSYLLQARAVLRALDREGFEVRSKA